MRYCMIFYLNWHRNYTWSKLKVCFLLSNKGPCVLQATLISNDFNKDLKFWKSSATEALEIDLLSNSDGILRKKESSWIKIEGIIGQNVLIVFTNAFKIVVSWAMMAKVAFFVQNLNLQDLDSPWKNKQCLSNNPLKFQCLKGVQKHRVAYKTY